MLFDPLVDAKLEDEAEADAAEEAAEATELLALVLVDEALEAVEVVSSPAVEVSQSEVTSPSSIVDVNEHSPSTMAPAVGSGGRYISASVGVGRSLEIA